MVWAETGFKWFANEEEKLDLELAQTGVAAWEPTFQTLFLSNLPRDGDSLSKLRQYYEHIFGPAMIFMHAFTCIVAANLYMGKEGHWADMLEAMEISPDDKQFSWLPHSLSFVRDLFWKERVVVAGRRGLRTPT